MPDWLRELAEKFPREVGLPFFCNVRANLVTPEKIELLKQAGCASVGMGLETGNPALRNEILKRNLSDEQIVEASRSDPRGRHPSCSRPTCWACRAARWRTTLRRWP